MDKDVCMEEKENVDDQTNLVKESDPGPFVHRYTKEKLLEIKELPISNERPECLLDKYDSDGVWDPEKWHASLYPSSERDSPVDGHRKEYMDDRVLKRRIADPRERIKDDDLEVVLSPQRRSFGGGCQGNAALPSVVRRPVSPLENKENESLRLVGSRRIGSGRIMAARTFERDLRPERELRPDKERERDYKDKRFRRDFVDKRVFSERRRNDSYAEEEPEWFSGGPTSQSETIELIGFDDKIIEDDRRRLKRSRKKSDSIREVECNGGLSEEPEVARQSGADQEVPHAEVPPEQTAGEFDFNEFFNLEKTMPGLASMIEDVLGEGPVSASRFSRWFSSNMSPSGSRSSSLRSTPHEELERLAGLDPRCSSPTQGPAPYFTPITSAEGRDKVDILELLHKAKIDLKPLLSSLSANKARLKESTSTGVVLSLEEVEGGLKGLRVQSEQPQAPRGGCETPFMAEQLEQALTGGQPRAPRQRDSDMSAFNKLVSCMKASGTLPTQPNLQQQAEPTVMQLPEAQVPAAQQNSIFQELMDVHGAPHPRSASPALLSSLLVNHEGPAAPPGGPAMVHRRGPSPPLFPQRAQMPDYFMPPTTGYPLGPQPMMGERLVGMYRSLSPVQPQQMRGLPMGVDLPDLVFQQDLAISGRHPYQQAYNKQALEKQAYRNRQPRLNRSPGPHPTGRGSPANPVTSMLSPSFTPTSVIRKMYETKEKTRDESTSRPGSKEDTANSLEDSASPSPGLDGVESGCPQGVPGKSCSTPVSSASSSSSSQHPRASQRPTGAAAGSSSGHHTPTLVSPGGSSSSGFPRPIYPVPLLSHVPLVRPAPPQLHPSVVQRMLAQGIQPQQLAPTLLQAGIYPQAVDLSQLQGLPPALLGQPLYPLGPTGHPLLAPRPGTPAHIQLAVLQQQQQLQQQQRPSLHPGSQGPPQSQSHGSSRTNQTQRRGGSPPPALAKWFGSDVLQQPLPSMPSAKVISVDELELRP
ncbi:hypothetical protein ACEWY4_013236 [Coilia grayii]|uniref:Eukaryotic translation initiation factor 4E transporter n=1 Tax=Coilia grayii TaxID=363190 RepID=A0ABD1JVR7_9TELE